HPRPRNVNLTRPVVAGLDTNAARPPASGFAAAAHHRARHRQAEPRVGALPLLVDVGVEDDLLVERDRQPGAGGDLAVELAGAPAAVTEEHHAALRVGGAGGARRAGRASRARRSARSAASDEVTRTRGPAAMAFSATGSSSNDSTQPELGCTGPPM